MFISVLCSNPNPKVCLHSHLITLGSQELSIKSDTILLIFLIYFSIVVKLEEQASLFVVMLTPSFVIRRKSAITSDLIFLRQLLMLAIC